jgi:hypothetical protein
MWSFENQFAKVATQFTLSQPSQRPRDWRKPIQCFYQDICNPSIKSLAQIVVGFLSLSLFLSFPECRPWFYSHLCYCLIGFRSLIYRILNMENGVWAHSDWSRSVWPRFKLAVKVFNLVLICQILFDRIPNGRIFPLIYRSQRPRSNNYTFD